MTSITFLISSCVPPKALPDAVTSAQRAKAAKQAFLGVKGFRTVLGKMEKWFYILKIWTPRKSISQYTYIGFGFKPLDLYIIL